MKLKVLKAVINNLPEESEIEIDQIEHYEANLVITTPDNERVTIGVIDLNEKESEE